MAKKLDIPQDNNIIKVPFEEAMPDNYLPYAVEVAKDRALPDVRDGLKPVHRRIIYGAYMLRATPDRPYYKSARIVGDILGKFHPHGDASVYDAMVILAQDFTTRMPLIDGHGNWGSIDGDNAAAMRYTEARLTPIAMEMVRDIDKDVVDMVDNYSATEIEPRVLPARYPNLLVNGTFGIAVGLATNIPPHNLGEVIDGTLAYIENPNISTTELMKHIKGPDLPTGGILIGKNALRAAYETGEGRVTLRAKTKIEKIENGRWAIIITEFPYRRNKARLLQNISEMTGDKKHSKALEAITDIRDESDRNGIRAVIEFRKSADEETVEKVLKYLYKKTDLQCNLSFNMVALAGGKPETLGLKQILMHYVNHQKEVITRRTKRELDIAEKRHHIVEGFMKAIDILDDILATIRASKSKQDSEKNLIERFGFTAPQAQAIVELMLYRLTGLEIKVFQKEYQQLEKLISELKKILSSERELLKLIRKELLEVKDKYADLRRTLFVEDDEEAKIDLEELVIVEDVVITLSKEGFIKRVPRKSFNRSSASTEDIDYREGDYNKFLLSSNTRDVLYAFTDIGNLYQLKTLNIPEMKWKEKGERIETLIKGLDPSEEEIIQVFSLNAMTEKEEFLFITTFGGVKKTTGDKLSTSYTKIMALKLREGERLIEVCGPPNELNDEEEDKLEEETAITKEDIKSIHFKTNRGLDFVTSLPELLPQDRNVLSCCLFTMPDNDVVTSADFDGTEEYREFFIVHKNANKVEITDTLPRNRDKYSIVKANSKSNILFFNSMGEFFTVQGFMLQNLKDSEIPIMELLGGNKEDEILRVAAINNYEASGYFYFFSRKGLVKKTCLKELDIQGFRNIAYKLKGEGDSLVAVDFSEASSCEEVIMVTRRGMAIRFDGSTINTMGRIASGVTGISLREDDELIFAAILKDTCSKEVLVDGSIRGRLPEEMSLTTNKKNSAIIKIASLKLQNRAGRGSNIMLVVMDEYLKKVEII